jgi:hypothetical protein
MDKRLIPGRKKPKPKHRGTTIMGQGSMATFSHSGRIHTMRQGENYNYEIVKINHQTHSCTVVGVVRGESVADEYARSYTAALSQEDREAGWGHFIQRTTSGVTIHQNRPAARKPGAGRKR